MRLIGRRSFSLLLASVFIAPTMPAVASGDEDVPPTDGKQTTVLVFGDSMADGLWGGMTRALSRDNSFKLLRRGKNGTGLARPDVYDWPASLPAMLDQEPPTVAVVSFGLNDRQDSFFEGRRQYYYKTDAWKQTYIERIEAILKPLAERKIKTYWVGLPIMRDPKVSKDAEYLNAIFADVVPKHGATFFPLWELSVDENHEYTSHGRGSDGRLRPFRNEDGMHFTMGGYDILARELLKTLSVQQLARVGN